MSNDVISMALREFVAKCEPLDHALCGDASCRALLEDHLGVNNTNAQAPPFDASIEAALVRTSMPEHRWTTTALMRTVSDLLDEHPMPGGLRRGIAITSALARLSERGMPPDAVVRTCIGPRLTRKMVLYVAAVWVAIADGKIERHSADQFERLLQTLDSEDSLADDRHRTIGSVVATGIHGQLGTVIKRWVDVASIADILSWNFDEYLPVEIHLEDRILSAGRNATVWVFDRFTKTYLPEWDQPSLDWELIYQQDPDLVAGVTGIPRQVLDERPVNRLEVVTALKHRLIGTRVDPDADQLRVLEVFEAAVYFLKLNRNHEALSIAQQAVVMEPANIKMRRILAFCLIPNHPAQALSVLADIPDESSLDADIRHANLASIYLAQGEMGKVRKIVEAISWTDPAQVAWLWQPASLVKRDATVVHITLGAWLADANAVIRT